MPPLALKLPQIIVKEKPIKLQDDPIENYAAFSDVDPIPHQKLFSNSQSSSDIGAGSFNEMGKAVVEFCSSGDEVMDVQDNFISSTKNGNV